MSDRNEIKFPESFNDLKNSLSSMIGMGLLIVLVSAGFTSVYTVPAESQGVVLRLGKFIKTVPAGLHFKMPYMIDRKYIIPVERQLAQEFGFSGSSSTRRDQLQELERNMVTGDKNAVTVEWVVQYKISDPKNFLFNVRDPEGTMRDIAESVMRTVVGDRTVDEVITIGRQEIATEAEVMMQDLVLKYELGLAIDQVQLNDVNPPGPVQPSFNEVNQAQQERERLINVANGEYNKASAQLRILERNTPTAVAPPPQKPQGRSKGPLVILLILLASTLAAAGTSLENPWDVTAYSLAFVTTVVALFFIPNWIAYRRAEAFDKAAEVTDSPEYTRKQNVETLHKIHSVDAKTDEVSSLLESTKDLLNFPYV